MATADSKSNEPATSGEKPDRGEVSTGAPQGGSVQGTIGRVVFLLAAGTALFYCLGRMTNKVRGIEEEAKHEAQERQADAGAPAKAPQTNIPELPLVSAYPNADSFSGGETFLLNGIPRRIATFVTHDRPNKVMDWYASAWKEVGLSPVGEGDETYASASATDVGSDLRHGIVAWWIEDSHVTMAHLSIATLTPIDTGFQQTHLPLPAGSVPVMDMRSSDAGASAAMVAYMLPMPPGKARNELLARLRDAGWKYEENYSKAPDERGWCVMIFSHGDRLLTLTLDPVADDKTSMIVNESVDLK